MDRAYTALEKAKAARDQAGANYDAAAAATNRLVNDLAVLSDAWFNLIAQISQRKCAAPQPQTAPQQPPKEPPPTGNPPKSGANQVQPPKETPAPKAKCPACQKVAEDIADLDAQIVTQERKVNEARKLAEVDVESYPSYKASKQKLSDLKAKKAELEKQLLKCEQSCAPKTATNGEVANTTGSVLQGNVLSGAVLQGVGVTAPPPNQPNRTGDGTDNGSSSESRATRPDR